MKTTNTFLAAGAAEDMLIILGILAGMLALFLVFKHTKRLIQWLTVHTKSDSYSRIDNSISSQSEQESEELEFV